MTGLKVWPIWYEDPTDYDSSGRILTEEGAFLSEEAAQRRVDELNKEAWENDKRGSRMIYEARLKGWEYRKKRSETDGRYAGWVEAKPEYREPNRETYFQVWEPMEIHP